MYIELTPIQVRLQDTNKCRSEYLEIFGYINGLNGNSSSNSVLNKDSKEIWKSYHLWCGPERSTNGPSPHSRYLISSSLLYMSLHTGASRKPRFFKIRYKGTTNRSKKYKINIYYLMFSSDSIYCTFTVWFQWYRLWFDIWYISRIRRDNDNIDTNDVNNDRCTSTWGGEHEKSQWYSD